MSSKNDSSEDDVITPTENASYTLANTEFTAFEKLKRKKYMPVLAKSEHGSLRGKYFGKTKELWVLWNQRAKIFFLARTLLITSMNEAECSY